MTDELAVAGFVDPGLQAEFPGLRLRWLTVRTACPPGGPSPPALRRRLSALADRYRGAGVVAMRTHPVAHAFRAFFRQVGLDPDAIRIPSEEAALTRLLQGGFRSLDTVRDALLIAVVETGVGVWALDADLVDACGFGIRCSRDGEPLGDGEHAHRLPPGRLVVADGARIHAVLFGEIARGHEPAASTERVALYAVGVDGVPAIHVEEALWTASEILAG